MDFYNLELSDTNVVDHNTHDFRWGYAFRLCIGLARTTYIRCKYGKFGRKSPDIQSYTVCIYIRFWPTLAMCWVIEATCWVETAWRVSVAIIYLRLHVDLRLHVEWVRLHVEWVRLHVEWVWLLVEWVRLRVEWGCYCWFEAAFWVSEAACWVSEAACWVSAAACWMSEATCWVSEAACRVSAAACSVSEATCWVSEAACWVRGLLLIWGYVLSKATCW